MNELVGVVQNYDWGDRRAIAELLGHEATELPEAEYWLGAHPKAPSSLVGDDGRNLQEAVGSDPIAAVGSEIGERFGGLPFLLKILAADRPLSIQAHPSLAQAKAGFAREELAGIDRLAPNRSYRDDNHKPELICALTPFEAKCGFRELAESRALLAKFTGEHFDDLNRRLGQAGSDDSVLADVVSWLLRLSKDEAVLISEAAVAQAAALASGPLGHSADGAQPADRFASELEWTGRIAAAFPGDIGVVVALLLNHVTLKPGQAVFLEAGNLHCYLQGVGVELMANSDNVLRGGLTTKNIDLDELLDVVSYSPINAPIQTAGSAIHTFHTPVPEFSLTRLDSTIGSISASVDVVGPEIVLVTSGEIELATASETLPVPSGSAVFVPFADRSYRIEDRSPGETVAWRAAVGGGPVS